MKTAVYSPVSENEIVSALQHGRCVITNGPMLVIEMETDTNNVGKIGETVRGKKYIVKVRAVTTEEFGKFKTIRIICGVIDKKERIVLEIKNFTDPFTVHCITDWETAENFSYIRAEASTKDALGIDREGFCYTNPIWIQPE